MRRTQRLLLTAVAIACISCGGSTPSAPSPVPISEPTPTPAPTPPPAPPAPAINLTGVWVHRDPAIGYTNTLTLAQSGDAVTGSWVGGHRQPNFQSDGVGTISGPVSNTTFTFAGNIISTSSTATSTQVCKVAVWGTLDVAGDSMVGHVTGFSSCGGRPGGSTHTYRKQ